MDATKNDATVTGAEAGRNFTPEDAGRIFNADFLDATTCRRWILQMVHGEKHPRCPECRAALEGMALQSFWEGKRIRCRQCEKFFTALTGTFLSGCHMDCREIILFAVLLYFGVGAHEIARILHISQETVRLWRIKFQALARIKALQEKLHG